MDMTAGNAVHELAANASVEQKRASLCGNDPVVLRGSVSSWPAVSAWQGDTGLARLANLAGEAPVQVMSAASELFFGAIEQHEPESMTFGQFLRLAPGRNSSTAATADLGTAGGVAAGQSAEAAVQDSSAQHPRHYYLAQADITLKHIQRSSKSDRHVSGRDTQHQPHHRKCAAGQPAQRDSLSALEVDFQPPPLLSDIAGELQTHLWMSIRGSRSSLHYDPYQNLLCVVRGSKTVHLHSPQQTAALYPKPAHGEAANHSSVNFAAPDLVQHPAYAQALQHQLTAELQAGDAVFIPEGWWHQIDSADIAIAVNFWWQSPFSTGLQAAASPVHLREAARAVAAQRVDDWLGAVVPPVPLLAAHEQIGTEVSCGGPLADWHWQPFFGSLQACELQAASTLALLTAEAMGAAASDSSIGSETDDSYCDSSDDVASGFTAPAEGRPPGSPAAGAEQAPGLASEWQVPPPPQDLGLQHPLTRLLSDLRPGALCRVLLMMAADYPAALEGLLLYALPPAAAEVLLRKLEAADELPQMRAHRAAFYGAVYGVVLDTSQLLAVLLAKKERVAQAALQQVVAEALG